MSVFTRDECATRQLVPEVAERGSIAAAAGRHPLSGGTNMKRLLALIVISMFSMGTLTACNTMAGAGKDVQKVGEKVTDKAEDCKDAKC
jgi:predicted small secreted protein